MFSVSHDFAQGLFTLLALVFWLGALTFIILMVLRLVKGVENIARELSIMNQTRKDK